MICSRVSSVILLRLYQKICPWILPELSLGKGTPFEILLEFTPPFFWDSWRDCYRIFCGIISGFFSKGSFRYSFRDFFRASIQGSFKNSFQKSFTAFYQDSFIDSFWIFMRDFSWDSFKEFQAFSPGFVYRFFSGIQSFMSSRNDSGILLGDLFVNSLEDFIWILPMFFSVIPSFPLGMWQWNYSWIFPKVLGGNLSDMISPGILSIFFSQISHEDISGMSLGFSLLEINSWIAPICSTFRSSIQRLEPFYQFA